MKDRKKLKKALTATKKEIEKEVGHLKAFRKFPRGKSEISFKGYICPNEKIWNLYKQYSRLCLDLSIA